MLSEKLKDFKNKIFEEREPYSTSYKNHPIDVKVISITYAKEDLIEDINKLESFRNKETITNLIGSAICHPTLTGLNQYEFHGVDNLKNELTKLFEYFGEE